MTRRVLGSELAPGMAIGSAVIVAVRPYRIPASVLHDYYAKRHPDGMPGFTVDTAPSYYGFTAFADELYEVEP